MNNWSTQGVWSPCMLMKDKVQLHCHLREGGTNMAERLYFCRLSMTKTRSVSWGLVVGVFWWCFFLFGVCFPPLSASS